jgi:hypothetical protein
MIIDVWSIFKWLLREIVLPVAAGVTAIALIIGVVTVLGG